MRELTPAERESIYPAECHFKVIAEGQDTEAKIESVLRKHGVKAPLHKGGISRTGRYRTFNVSTWIGNYETMASLEKALLAIEGVKTVL